MESNDSPEIPYRGETSDIPSLPLGDPTEQGTFLHIAANLWQGKKNGIGGKGGRVCLQPTKDMIPSMWYGNANGSSDSKNQENINTLLCVAAVCPK